MYRLIYIFPPIAFPGFMVKVLIVVICIVIFDGYLAFLALFLCNVNEYYLVVNHHNNGTIVIQVAGFRTGSQANKQRKLAADKLLSSLKNKNLLLYIVAVESFINGCRKVSQVSRLPKTTKDFDLKDYQITQTTDLNVLPIPTLEYPVLTASQQYFTRNGKNGIHLIEQHVKAKSAASGIITRPVIVHILGNDGGQYRQLIKPSDNLRQVMEQVFGLVNELMIQNISTLDYDLHMRTYKVTSLTPGVGIVEWVLNTVPIGIYLSQAHLEYECSRESTQRLHICCDELVACHLDQQKLESNKKPKMKKIVNCSVV